MIRVEISNTFTKGFSNYLKKAGIHAGLISGKAQGADREAKIKVGLQLINFVINGSSNESVTPPVKWGNLRASGSVFVGSEFVGGNNLYPITKRTGEVANTSYTASFDEITVGFNAAYANRMHETDWHPGSVSEQSGNTGNKYLEKHLIADKETLVKTYSLILKKGTGA